MSKFITAIDESTAIELELSMVEESFMDLDIATEGMLSKAGELLKTAGEKLVKFIGFLIGLIPKAIEKVKTYAGMNKVKFNTALDFHRNEHKQIQSRIVKFISDAGAACKAKNDEKITEIRDAMREYKHEIGNKTLNTKNTSLVCTSNDLQKWLKDINDMLETNKKEAERWQNTWKFLHDNAPGTTQEKNNNVTVNCALTIEFLIREFCSVLKVCILLMEKAEPVK